MYMSVTRRLGKELVVKTTVKVAALLALCLALTGLPVRQMSGGEAKGKGKSNKGTEHPVSMQDGDKFVPPSITIKVGDSVRWTNDSKKTHTATSDNIGDTADTFNTARVAQKQSAVINFNKAGTYPYHCKIHPGMTGTIKVE
jgi:plastocyanin